MPALKNDECWYALRTFRAQEFKVSQYLDQCHLGHFIPMTCCVQYTEGGAPIRTERPAVHNLIFLKKHIENEEKWYEISNQEILDLRLLCDSSFHPQFISQEECDLEVGSEVVITHGPFKTLTGKLVRKNKKYYFVKCFAGMAVRVSISRWCCQKIADPKAKQ